VGAQDDKWILKHNRY